MALLDRRLKQRMVGAAVLVALGVVFLPMLFNREDEQRRVRVDAPPMPPAPQVTVATPEPVLVPEPQAEPTPTVADEPPPSPPVEPVAAAQPVPQQTVAPVAPVESQAPSRLDADGVPVSWTVQLASLSNRARAEELQRKLRSQGLDAYVRTVDGMHRVFVGPLLERADADRVREQVARQHKLSPIVVRFQPERR
ncbi:MAG: SPOR domain-containing protein [Pseudomonas sp.]|nr:SPOR domain-containing protein [Pseudomonas sp.]